MDSKLSKLSALFAAEGVKIAAKICVVTLVLVLYTSAIILLLRGGCQTRESAELGEKKSTAPQYEGKEIDEMVSRIDGMRSRYRSVVNELRREGLY